MILILSCICVFTVGHAAPTSEANADKVAELPGLNFKIDFSHYSGYLNVSETKSFHYWYVESQNKTSSDPVFLWLTGGPGCSSLDGLLSELGPFHVKDDWTTLYENPYSWNKLANVLFLESPAGVGYSYSTDGKVATNDDETSQLNYNALKEFFKRFPDLMSNDFYITGESYGGIYVPTLAVRVLDGIADFPLKFKGVAIGNGMLSFDLNPITSVSFGFAHGLIGPPLFKDVENECCKGCVESCTLDNPSDTCNNHIADILDIMLNRGLNMYDLYRNCYHSSVEAYPRFWSDVNGLFPQLKDKLSMLKQSAAAELDDTLGLAPPCMNVTAVTSYLNQKSVRKALHIPDELPEWEICNADVNLNYTNQYQNMKSQFNKMLGSGLRILVYHGDVDMACNFLMGERFVRSLDQKLLDDTSPWHCDNQIAGFITKYQNLDFVTVKGAGHMVPQFRPPQALKMITNFINEYVNGQQRLFPLNFLFVTTLVVLRAFS